MSANPTAAPATPAPLALVLAPDPYAPVDNAPAAVAPVVAAAWPRFTPAPIAASIAVRAPIAPGRGAPLERTATYLDLRVWPGSAAAAGLREMPVVGDKSLYWKPHYTKTKWAGEDPAKLQPKRKKKRVVAVKTVPGLKWRKAVANGTGDRRELDDGHKKMAAKFSVRYDLRCVMRQVKNVKGYKGIIRAVPATPAVKAARIAPAVAVAPPEPPSTTKSARSKTARTTTTSTRAAATVNLAMPGALLDEAQIEMQTDAAADDSSPSFGVALFRFAVNVFSALTKRKRPSADDEVETRDLKRRRVESNEPSPSRAADRPTAGKPARSTSTTGATASTHSDLTATATPSAAPKPLRLQATLSKCPPPPAAGAKKNTTPSGTAASKGKQPAGMSRASAPTSSAARAPKPLSREPATLIDLGPTAGPSSAPSKGLKRQAAFVFGSDANRASSSAAAAAASKPKPAPKALSREPATVVDLGPAAGPSSGPSNLKRQPAFVFDFGNATSSSTAAASTQRAPKALSREPATIIDLGPTAGPSSSSQGLARQPAFVFDLGSAANAPVPSAHLLLAGSEEPLYLAPLWKMGRGKRSGRTHKHKEHKEAKSKTKGGRKNEDRDGARKDKDRDGGAAAA